MNIIPDRESLLEDGTTEFDPKSWGRPRYEQRSDLVHALHADHDEIRRRFSHLLLAGPEERGGRWQQVAHALTVHTRAEHEVVFSLTGKDREIEALTDAIEALDPTSEGFSELVQRLRSEVEEHVEEEEGSLMPALEAALTGRDLERMTLQFEQRKRSIERRLLPPGPVVLQLAITAPDPIHGATVAFRDARILVVTDVETEALQLEQILARAAYTRVEVTADPCAVFGLHRRNAYDLILLDLHARRMSGFEVMRTLQRIEPDGQLPVLALTARPADHLRAVRAGARDFLAKPFDPDEVLVRVSVALEARMAELARGLRLRGFERDGALAAEIYRALLPRSLAPCPGYEVAAGSRWVGDASGDVYDVLHRPDGRCVLLLADATGHGIGPALCALQLRSMVRMALSLGASVEEMVAEADRQLTADLPPDRFVTAFLGELDPVTHCLSYIAAGQGPLLHWHAAPGRAEWRNASGPPFGVAGGPFERAPAIHLAVGDVVVLATDGVYERTDAAGEMFGESGIEELLFEASPSSSAAALARALEARTVPHDGSPAHDDATWIVLKRTAGTRV